MDCIWKRYNNNMFVCMKGRTENDKMMIAAFDLDHTLIVPKSGNVFPISTKDWKFLYDFIPDKLRELNNEGYRLIVVTNQLNVDRVPFRLKIEDVFSNFDFPIELYAAITDDIYRKPRIGVWKFVGNVDREKSFFVGDSAGRRAIVGKKRDYSCCDRLFALNSGIRFFTPEEYFLNCPEIPYDVPILSKQSRNDLRSYRPSGNREIIVLVGCPASGKTAFATKYFSSSGYRRINRDSWRKCLAAAENALKDDVSIVIDNTNPNVESRKLYVDLAKRYKVLCKCFVMNVDIERAIHNEKFRMLTNEDHVKIPEIAFRMYFKKFVFPTLSEGFREITLVEFFPEFNDPDKEQLYNMYL